MRFVAHVFVTLKAAVHDPQGDAIRGGLRSLGFLGVESVRAGKFLELELDAEDRPTAERQVDEMCSQLLANPVIEAYRFDVLAEGDPPARP